MEDTSATRYVHELCFPLCKCWHIFHCHIYICWCVLLCMTRTLVYIYIYREIYFVKFGRLNTQLIWNSGSIWHDLSIFLMFLDILWHTYGSLFVSPLNFNLPSGKHTKNYGTSPFLIGKSTISMAIFNSYVSLPEGTSIQTSSLLIIVITIH